MHIKSSRRNFLRSSAVLGATCMLGSTARPTSGGSSVIVVGAGAFADGLRSSSRREACT
jgi:TAT (twin-arginine translocation) pathway-exported protein